MNSMRLIQVLLTKTNEKRQTIIDKICPRLLNLSRPELVLIYTIGIK